MRRARELTSTRPTECRRHKHEVALSAETEQPGAHLPFILCLNGHNGEIRYSLSGSLRTWTLSARSSKLKSAATGAGCASQDETKRPMRYSLSSDLCTFGSESRRYRRVWAVPDQGTHSSASSSPTHQREGHFAWAQAYSFQRQYARY